MLKGATIVLGVDLKSAGGAGLVAAMQIAEHFGAQRLVLAHGVGCAGVARDLTGAHDQTLTLAKERMACVEVEGAALDVKRVVRTGPPARVLVEAAEEYDAELIIVSSRGKPTLQRTLRGSVTSDVLRRSSVPVLVVGYDRTGRGPIEAVTVAVDLSDPVQGVLRWACRLAADYDAQLRVISVPEDERLENDDVGGPSAASERERARVRDQFKARLQRLVTEEALCVSPEHVELQLIEGMSPHDAITTDLRNHPASMLVIGTSGHGPWERLLHGSTAEQISADAPVPVFVVPAPAAARLAKEDPAVGGAVSG
jgi:nucleotide-binding universal stress UspA family protein